MKYHPVPRFPQLIQRHGLLLLYPALIFCVLIISHWVRYRRGPLIQVTPPDAGVFQQSKPGAAPNHRLTYTTPTNRRENKLQLMWDAAGRQRRGELLGLLVIRSCAAW